MMGRTTVDKDPLLAFARRAVEVAETEDGIMWTVKITGEYLVQVRSYVAGYDAGVADVLADVARRDAAQAVSSADG